MVAYDLRNSSFERVEYLDLWDTGFVLIDSTRTLITTNRAGVITYTLPPQYFPLPKCCDRDLYHFNFSRLTFPLHFASRVLCFDFTRLWLSGVCLFQFVIVSTLAWWLIHLICVYI